MYLLMGFFSSNNELDCGSSLYINKSISLVSESLCSIEMLCLVLFEVEVVPTHEKEVWPGGAGFPIPPAATAAATPVPRTKPAAPA